MRPCPLPPPNAGVPSANARVGGVVWGAEGKAYSAGWNGSVREWDVDSQSASSSKVRYVCSHRLPSKELTVARIRLRTRCCSASTTWPAARPCC